MHRRIVVTCLSLLLFAACGGDDNAGTTTAATRPGDNPLTSDSLAPPTTFIPDCALMPATADISAAVGIPLAGGQVVGAGTCQYLGLNDQSRVVTLAIFTDPVDQASFTELQASLGTPTPLNDPTVPNAMVGVDATLFVVANNAVYTVNTLVTDGTAAEQVPLSAAVLRQWLTL